ncbi:phosphodiester glycosidase family protein [Ulvibacterium sp.]|uniref:T9SS type A sorting domain-containing protein n=1 Tax=Ulvibacterium sp. TaxID=2665914 RepID=UPI003CC5A968
MRHIEIKVLGEWLPLLMMLTIMGTIYGQGIGLDPMALTDQSLSAYSTDFPDWLQDNVKIYESPNPKKNPIWEEEDMYTINFKELLGKQGTEKPTAFMKVALKASEIPKNSRKNSFIEVDLFLYDEEEEHGYDEGQKLISIFMTYDRYLNYFEIGDGETSRFIASKNESMKAPNSKTYDSNRIKQALWNLGLATKLKNTTEGKVVFRMTFHQVGKLVNLQVEGLGEIEPQQLLYAKSNNVFNDPSKKETVVDFPQSTGITIDRWTWNSGKRLYGTTNNILNIAELDFSASSNVELQLDYVFKDPRSDPENFNPKTLKNNDGSPGILSASELEDKPSMDIVQSIMLDQPQAGMFDVVSHRAARAGALFAVNGAFYDYYYYCLPGVKTSLKVDGTWRYVPDIFNHRNTGALVFNKNNDFKFLRNDREYDFIGDKTGYSYDAAKSAYLEQGGGWPNLMSGGHFSELGKPYRFFEPEIIKELKENGDYFWENPRRTYPNIDDITESKYKNWNATEFRIWARIACQRYDTAENHFSFSDAFNPAYLHQDGMVKINNNQIDFTGGKANKIYTTVDYRRYKHEFGIQKRGRTFIAKKGRKFYIITADGEYNLNCQLEYKGYKGKDARYYATVAPGLTIDELSDLSQKLEFDALLNLDGGGSSTFFVNGKGMLQTPYAGHAEGPMQQRYLSTTLMIVPKIVKGNIKPKKNVNQGHLYFDNSGLQSESFGFQHHHIYGCPPSEDAIAPIIPYRDWPKVRALSLTPSIDKFTKVSDANKGGLITGTFNGGLASSGTEGAILFALSENGQYTKRKEEKTNLDTKEIFTDPGSLFVIGVGKMPEMLRKVLGKFHFYDSNTTARQEAWEGYLTDNNQAFYSILVNNNKIYHYVFDKANSWSHYLDGKWHQFTVSYNNEQHHTGYSSNALYTYVDGIEVTFDDDAYLWEVDSLEDPSYFFQLNDVTHAMIGAIPLKGNYLTPKKSNLKVDNYMFLVGHSALEELRIYLIDKYNAPFDLGAAIKQFSSDIASNDYTLPDSYDSFEWSDPAKNRWYLQFEEGTGYHAHAVNDTQALDENGKPYFYGLNLWGSWVTESSAKKEVADTAKALDSIVDPITDEPLNANPTLEFGSAGVSHTEEAPDASATNSLTEDTLRHSWNVYPNPASSSLFLDLVLEESTPLDIYLFNLSGQQLFHARSARMERGTNRVDLGEIARRFGGKQQLYTLKVRGNGFAPIDTKVMIK